MRSATSGFMGRCGANSITTPVSGDRGFFMPEFRAQGGLAGANASGREMGVGHDGRTYRRRFKGVRGAGFSGCSSAAQRAVTAGFQARMVLKRQA